MTEQLPDVSVILCAYTERRWHVLMRALAALRTQTVLPREVLIVVDHNPHLLARLRAEVPDALVLENLDAMGASGARNTAIAQARGDLLAFLDDDATPRLDWLERLTAPFEDAHVAGVGGASLPRWEGDRPRWFPPEFDWVIGCSYPGMPTQLAPVRNLWGVSMALRRSVLLQSGGFHTALGPVGTVPINCEETELCLRIRRFAPHWTFLYEPRAVVLHHVPRERARWRYYLVRCFHEGHSKALLSARWGAGDGLRSERDYVAHILPHSMLRNLGQILRGRDRRGGGGRVAALLAGLAAAACGYLMGMPAPLRGIEPARKEVRA